MTDEHEQPEPQEDDQPNPGPTRRLEKAIEDMGSGDYGDGTLVSIEAHTGEHAVPPEPSVTDSLKKAKQGSADERGPDIQPAATMYEPTRPGHVSTGSQDATVYGPTDTDQPQGSTPRSGSLNTAGSGGRPVAPFGGKIMVGTRVGQIEVTGVLGKGGMGEVFKGYHHALDINVALKVLPDELSRNELVRQRFLREARLCVKLDHPHIVRVYNVDEYAGNLYLVMEMIEGTDAAHMLKNGGRFRYKRALEIGAAGADALAYAHTQGLVHRDVKPHNILLGATDGRIKLSDFGLARAATSSSHLTMSGQIMGTPHYMSPEQAESKEVTDKSDVYSLGVSLYHMLTGETPFVGDTPISVAVQHIAKEIIYPEVRFKPFPKELVAVLKRMTAKDSAKRCSAKQAAVWLRKLIGMATDEDVRVEDEGAMKSMAPVVRESQAFEAAAKERAQRDNHARELAQTMMATMKEDSARRPSVSPTMAESAPAYSSQATQSSGAGSKVLITILVMLLLGGGAAAAGWYFTLGPGANNGKGNQPIVAGDDGAANKVDSTPKTNSGSTDGGTTDGGSTDGGTTDGGSTDGGSTDGGSTDGGTTPPPVQDDPLVADALTSASAAIINANTLADLDAAKKQLDRAKMEISKASAQQRAAFDDLDARYHRQFAYLAASEGFDRIREALKTFEEKRFLDTDGAIVALNTAILERDGLANLKVPPEAEERVARDREVLNERVDTALSEFWNELDTQALRLEREQQFDDAAGILADLETIKGAPEELAKVSARLRVMRVLGIHKVVKDALAIPKYQFAIDQLKKAEELAVPEELQGEHAKVVASVGAAIEKDLQGYLKAARDAADRSDFIAARNERDAANDLPVYVNEQVSRIADVGVYIDLSELTVAVEKETAEGKFNEAKVNLDAGAAKITGSADRKLPQSLILRYNDVAAKYETELAKRLKGLLDSAKASIDSKDFESASADISAADKLPLSDEQQTELDKFKQANETALSEYVSTLITEIERALDDSDFEDASTRLELVKTLRVPDDQRDRLAKVDSRYGTEAIKYHSDLLEAVRKALDKRDYADARKALDAALEIPVVGTAADKARELDKDYTTLLTGDVTARLEQSDLLVEKDSFAEAKTVLDDATKLPLTEELDRQVARKLEQWAEKVEQKLTQLLKDAAEDRDARLFSKAGAFIKEAYLLPLDKDQKVRVSKAEDELKAAVNKHKEGLFKELEDCVKKGLEKDGKKVIEQLRALGLDPGDQSRINDMEASLTGENESDRFKRLPSHLRTAWQDRYCKAEQLFNVGEEISSVAVTPDGKYAAVGGSSGRVFFFNLKRGTQLGSSKGGTRRITAMAVSDDGKYAASGNDDGNLVVFELSGNSVQASDLGSAGDDVYGLAFSGNNNVLFAATRDGSVSRYNPVTKTRIGGATPTGLDRAQCMALSPDGSLLAIGGEDAYVAVFDASRMVIKQKLQGPGDDLIQSVAFSADSGQLIAGSIGDDVAVWNTRRLTEKPTKQYKGLSEWVRGVGFSSDGRRCAAFDNEKRLMVWDARSGTEQRQLEFVDKLKGDKDFVPSAGVIGPDGTVLIATREGELIHMQLKSAG
ncbi:MAG: protein kinase [Planctomycetes bacterium]|nr:protein kinase [Planctomycetota bacterium]